MYGIVLIAILISLGSGVLDVNGDDSGSCGVADIDKVGESTFSMNSRSPSLQ